MQEQPTDINSDNIQPTEIISDDSIEQTKEQSSMTPAGARKAIVQAMKNKQISHQEGTQLLRQMGLTQPSRQNKKTITKNERLKKRKVQKKSRKLNRK